MADLLAGTVAVCSPAVGYRPRGGGHSAGIERQCSIWTSTVVGVTQSNDAPADSNPLQQQQQQQLNTVVCHCATSPRHQFYKAVIVYLALWAMQPTKMRRRIPNYPEALGVSVRALSPLSGSDRYNAVECSLIDRERRGKQEGINTATSGHDQTEWWPMSSFTGRADCKLLRTSNQLLD